MKLILMRHAKSSWDMPLDDHSRPLNPRGRKAAKALGDWLRDKGHVPEQAIISDAVRAQETYARLGVDADMTAHRSLYLAPASSMWVEITKRASADYVLVVGHNPGIGVLAGLIGDHSHPRFEDYPTGATMVVAIQKTDGPPRGHVLDFVVPRDLVRA